jgi:lysozyme family protein
MSDFNDAIPTVLRREGGFENNVNDPGGATNFGVSLRWLKSQGLLSELEIEEGDKTQDEVQVIRIMTQAQAEGFYKCWWWNKYNYQNFISQAVANKVFDTAVNMGASRSHRILQKIVGLPQDGVLGPKSFAEANAMSPSVLIVNFQSAQAQFYRDLVAKNPKLQEFLTGWLNRAYDRN